MDVSDPGITFDEDGICNHCRQFDLVYKPVLDRATSSEGPARLAELVESIKAEGVGKDYDCIIGISGGVDSTYVAWKVKELGLRPLAVHFDSGWNSELAVANIENLVKRLGFDLHTFVVDWEEMADLQLAFFKASLANCDIPTDHGFLAVLYHTAAKYGMKTFISGGNIATESILPTAWGYNAGDRRHLRAVHRQFGKLPLKTYPTLSFFDRYFWFPAIKGFREVRILNYLDYRKDEAKELIKSKLDWRDYGGKHYESIFTRFFQAYYLPQKFGFDKRKAHLSSLIVSGQITREEALQELNKPTAPADLLERDKEFVARKIGITPSEFDEILARPPRSYREFSSNEWLFDLKTHLVRRIRKR
jgi:N-acetyl sugar amidotransferase